MGEAGLRSEGMDTDDRLEAAQAQNQSNYGTPDEARAYAEDMGAVYCEHCGTVYFAQPEMRNDGHDCPAH